MRRWIRILGTVLVVAGTLTLVWALVVWQWQDPFTALYTKWRQHQLTGQYEKRVESFRVPPAHTSPVNEQRTIALLARRYRRQAKRGEAIGRIKVPRMGVNMILVNGTDHDTLKKGPGRDLRTFMPGENRVTLEVPYATFIYSVTGHRIVKSTDLSVLRSPRHELVELQACHPRFFASHRFIAYARLIRVEPRGAAAYNVTALAQGSGK
jgi:sortase A